ncbi:hypothetical protein GCWU000282_02285 [Catonella morbi ATCC 51271]|uniref:Uncharacterized protein n=1 Tax=Catonella morbi ATCC 51271 TaxID=592026 RepID=V2Y394_9FIRM|nr:hypothetical protein GCWU000282_02285 [Catonella morbi ATCC 51271]
MYYLKEKDRAERDILEAFFKAENERNWEQYRKFLHPKISWELFDKEEDCWYRGYEFILK